jgi:hypothetical protein
MYFYEEMMLDLENIQGFVTCVYSDFWWLVYVLGGFQVLSHQISSPSEEVRL